ncbi:ferritin-like domain-containing protein [Phytoactinopolyspora alkaliphila]|uniref:Ferritin-like domain-containing protein n=1 Tax=Phytoactinopolyspora alkaliphila TaxID=1783498 RepID=A0A6N9YTX7_9ACTN|nr:ferritin-like domain-containing protein [Phytoactinopolyspora alkaliphila]NED98501.1 ferritin-like domain-containing protein [Phytoactinopolyspora alkaliphila]
MNATPEVTFEPTPGSTADGTAGDTPEATPASDDPAVSDQVIAATQAALAGEHACVYGYGVVGAYLSDDAQTAAREDLAAHESQRDLLRGYLSALDAVPEAASPAYALPFTVDDAASARAFAGELEDRLAAVYLDLVASGPGLDLRRMAADALVASALRRRRWTGEVSAFPGLDEREGAPGG